MPRSAAVALRQPPGWQSIFEDDFSDGLQAWTVSGKPIVDGDPPAAALTAVGQSLAFTPPEPPAAGRVGVNFRERDAAGGRWSMELRFQGDGEPRTLRVTVASVGDAYEVEPAGLDGDGRRVVRSPGWHRLTVRFSRDSLSVLCDDAVLWSNLRQGPGGALRQVALVCSGDAKSDAVRGRVDFAEFSLSRAADEAHRPAGDPTQEEVWLADGDQLFGDGLHIDRRSVEIRVHSASAHCRGPTCAAAGYGAMKNSGAYATRLARRPCPSLDRLRSRSGAGRARRRSQGDRRQASDVDPSVLGELHVPRDRLRRLRPIPG